MQLLNWLLDRMLFLIGGLLGAQIPGFISHYVQRLGGHLDEASRNVEVLRHSVSPQTLEPLNERVAYLQTVLNAISSPNPFSKFYAFIKTLDYDVARNTLANYVPNLPTTLEGVLYALLGALVFSLIYRLLSTAVLPRKPSTGALVDARFR
jgi:hypothetical protein